MSEFLELTGPLSVTARVLIGLGLLSAAAALILWLATLIAGWRVAAGGLGLVIGGGLLAILFLPVGTAGLGAPPDPAATFEDAVARFEQDLAASPVPLNPLCAPELMTHGGRTGTVVVLIHGVSSCPRAFVDLAPLLHARGHTVMTVRLPQNGHADRATDALRLMTAEALAAFGDEVVDVASGLGDSVVVLGISAGGTVAGWTAQTRGEVDRAVLVAPFYGLGSFGPRLNVALMRAMLILPDVSIWKDPVARAAFEGGMPHAYKRQSTRATGEIMRLGFATWRLAREDAPRAGEIVVVTNDADSAVSNETTGAVVGAWEADGTHVVTHTFPAHHGLGHELIDPMEPGANPAITYPVIVGLLEGGTPLEGGAALAD